MNKSQANFTNTPLIKNKEQPGLNNSIDSKDRFSNMNNQWLGIMDQKLNSKTDFKQTSKILAKKAKVKFGTKYME